MEKNKKKCEYGHGQLTYYLTDRDCGKRKKNVIERLKEKSTDGILWMEILICFTGCE